MKMEREILIEYYKHISNYYNTDFHRKDISAWAGLVLFFVFCTMINQIDKSNCGLNVIIILVTIGVALIFFFYIKNQFSVRDLSGDCTSAALKITLQLMDSNLSEEDLQEYCIINDKCCDHDLVACHVLSKKTFDEIKDLKDKGTKKLITTKRITYILIVISLLVTIVQRFLN